MKCYRLTTSEFNTNVLNASFVLLSHRQQHSVKLLLTFRHVDAFFQPLSKIYNYRAKSAKGKHTNVSKRESVFEHNGLLQRHHTEKWRRKLANLKTAPQKKLRYLKNIFSVDFCLDSLIIVPFFAHFTDREKLARNSHTPIHFFAHARYFSRHARATHT